MGPVPLGTGYFWVPQVADASRAPRTGAAMQQGWNHFDLGEPVAAQASRFLPAKK